MQNSLMLSLSSTASSIFFFIKAYPHSENTRKQLTSLYASANVYDSSKNKRR